MRTPAISVESLVSRPAISARTSARPALNWSEVTLVALLEAVVDRLGDDFGLVAGDAASGELLGDGKRSRPESPQSECRPGAVTWVTSNSCSALTWPVNRSTLLLTTRTPIALTSDTRSVMTCSTVERVVVRSMFEPYHGRNRQAGSPRWRSSFSATATALRMATRSMSPPSAAATRLAITDGRGGRRRDLFARGHSSHPSTRAILAAASMGAGHAPCPNLAAYRRESGHAHAVYTGRAG